MTKEMVSPYIQNTLIFISLNRTVTKRVLNLRFEQAFCVRKQYRGCGAIGGLSLR